MNTPGPPPSGATPPVEAYTPDGIAIDLRPLAREICDRYRAEFPDEQQRYGAAGVQWCLHDNQYLLAWAFQDARDGTVVLSEQAAWLARVLTARDFPVARLARDLEIAAEITRENLTLSGLADTIADRLAAAATAITSTPGNPADATAASRYLGSNRTETRTRASAGSRPAERPPR